MLYGINTWALKQTFLYALETVICSAYLLLIKYTSTYKNSYHHDHPADGKEIPHWESCTLTYQFLLGKFQERLIENDFCITLTFTNFKYFITGYWDGPETLWFFSPTKKKSK